jgi:hypothetical protein
MHTSSIERTFTELIHFHHFLVSTPCLIRTVIPPPLPLITPYDDPNTKVLANQWNKERVQLFFTRLQNNEALVREVFAMVEHNIASMETGIAEAEGGWAFLESQFAVSWVLFILFFTLNNELINELELIFVVPTAHALPQTTGKAIVKL